jgi:DNA-binding NarL/FixJ family response regulator
MLEQEVDMQVVGEAGDGEETVKLACELKPDVAIVDISMPKLDGIEATKQIKERCPSVTILILSAHDDDQFIFSLLEAGAAGYLLKSIRSRELVDAVRAVHAGESVLHPSIAKKVLNRFVSSGGKPQTAKPVDVLSDREKEIVRLATKGLSNADIAKELCLSVRTVQGHLGHIFNKLQVGSRTEAVVRALKEGWVTLDDIP